MMRVDNEDISAVREQIDTDFEEHVNRLQEAIRQPSLSVDDIGLEDMAKLAVNCLKETGADEADLVKTGGSPGVWGFYDAGAEKTIVTYGMLDTRLVTDEEEWDHPPFGAERTEIDPFGEVIVGRITAKGAFIAYLNALEATKKALGDLPVNIAILAETEEINGSPHYYEMLDRYEDRVRDAEACYGPGFTQDESGNIRGALGYKSALYFDLRTSGQAWGYGPQGNDVHAMSNAILDNPAWRLICAMSSLVDKDGREVAIDGYYDQYEPPTAAESEEIHQYVKEIGDEKEGASDLWKQAPGLNRGAGKVERLKDDLQMEDAVEVFLQAFYGPVSFNVQGFRSGFLGSNTNTRPFRLPHEATATFDVRMPRGYDPEVVLGQLRKHLDLLGYEDVEVDVAALHRWSRTTRDADIVETVREVITNHDANLTLAPYSCGGVPWAAFASRYDIPVLHGVGLGYQGSDGTHEFIALQGTDSIAGVAEAEQAFAEILLNFSLRSNSD